AIAVGPACMARGGDFAGRHDHARRPIVALAVAASRSGRGVPPAATPRWDRLEGLGGATLLVAMITPVVRSSPWLSPIPDPIEWYLRPLPGRGTFTLFPWASFLLAGAAVGLWLDSVRTPGDERRI